MARVRAPGFLGSTHSLMNDRVLFLSHTQDSGPFKVGSHHLAHWFAEFGYEVVHLSTPHSLAHTLSRKGPPARAAAARVGVWHDEVGVRHVVPRTVMPVQVPVDRYLRCVQAASPRFVFLDQPLMAVRRYKRLGRTLIYRPTDLYPEGTEHRRQSRLLVEAQGVAATSQVVLDSLGPLAAPSTVIPNGVDNVRFARDSKRPRSGAVYVGALDDRFDWGAVRLIAERFSEVAIDIAGPAPGRVPALPPNVHLLGPVPYEDVPELLARHRVGLLPLSRSPLNAGRSPMKLYEYLAAGLQVVAAGSPGLRAAPVPGLHLYDSESMLVRGFERAIRSESNEEGRRIALAEDWEAKARRLEAFASEVEEHALRNPST